MLPKPSKHLNKNSLAIPPKIEPKQIHTPIRFSFHRVDPGAEFCLSHCGNDEVRAVVDCFRQMTTLSWMQVLQTGGKGANKAGLGCTNYDDDALKGAKRPGWLDKQINIYGLRASQKSRVFGYYLDHVFHVLWVDPNHKIVPA